MGFPAGFLAGLTLTAGTLYLSLLAHQHARARQHQHLASQAYVLHTLADGRRDPYSEYNVLRRRTVDTGAGAADEGEEALVSRRVGLVEMCKDRWNAEVEGMVRRVEQWRWSDVWEGVVAAQERKES